MRDAHCRFLLAYHSGRLGLLNGRRAPGGGAGPRPRLRPTKAHRRGACHVADLAKAGCAGLRL